MFNITNLATGFEGCEKKLELDFLLEHDNSSMRNIARSEWDAILDEAKCTIISVLSNESFDSYVLSESSLFVYPHKVMLKTCGTTSLLHCLPKLLKAAKAVDCDLDFVQFSRSNFMFPEEQPYPHRSFAMEVQYLNTFFPEGHAYILGPLNGPRWHLYTADLHPPDEFPETVTADQTLEMVMFDLDQTVMKQFYKKPDASHDKGTVYPSDGPAATSLSGIDTILPNAKIDSFLFDPCGYSCNGMKDNVYFTIHITPEPECSFVSFETNLKVNDYNSLVRHVLDVFKPGKFAISIMSDKKALIADDLSSGLKWQFDGFITKGRTYHQFEHSYHATCGQFASVGKSSAEYGKLMASSLLKQRSKESLEVELKVMADHFDETTKFMVPYRLSHKLQETHLLGVTAAAVKDSFCVHRMEGENVGSFVSEIIKADKPEDAFFVVNLDDIIRRFRRWAAVFPSIEPFYDVKCNSDKGLLLALNAIGVGFHAFSAADVKILFNAGVPSSRIVFSNPWKASSQINFAKEKNVGFMSFDNINEMRKLATLYPKAMLVLHLSVDVDGARPVLTPSPQTAGKPTLSSVSHGATIGEVPAILEELKALDMKLVGVSFDSGRTAATNAQFTEALKKAASVFRMAKRVLDVDLSLLDIGDGFADSLDTDPQSIEHVAEGLNKDIKKFFSPSVRVIARPSRFLISSSHTLAVSVIARRQVQAKPVAKNPVTSVKNSSLPDQHIDRAHAPSPEPCIDGPTVEPTPFMYYVNDGLYGSFNCLLYENIKVTPCALGKENCDAKELRPCVIFGPTCDGIDCISESAPLPELSVGEWLYFKGMGAYTVSNASSFNGFEPPSVKYVCSH